MPAVMIAIALAILMILKSFLFYQLLTAFKLRARTSFLTSLSLSNYSEFGLIVGAIGVSSGWMSGEWLVIIAVALSITFVVSSVADAKSHKLYAKYEKFLCRFERKQRLPDDMPIDVGDAQILVFGMGRVGTGVYDTLVEMYGKKILGIDQSNVVIENHKKEGRNAIIGDSTDFDFWERLKPGSVKMIMLDMPNLHELLVAVEMIKKTDFQGVISVAVKHDDCIGPLKAAGVDSVFNVYAEAGAGYANHVCESVKFKLD